MKAGFILILTTLLIFGSCNDNPVEIKIVATEAGMVKIPGGTLEMGGDNDQASRDEFPKHKVKVSGFMMDETEVTNRQFKEFVDATGYVTIAERPLDWEVLSKDLPPGTPKPPDSILQPGALVFQKTSQPVSFEDPSKWWVWTIGSNWKSPNGPGSSIDGKMDHPVVQVAWEDAKAYANWAGKRLPTEVEWEWAARGGKSNEIYPWGNEDVLESGHKYANFWQGLFPYKNTEKDGFELTSPVKSYPPNGYGLYDMAGNVWEWCEDWYDANFYNSAGSESPNTRGPDFSFNPMNPYTPAKVLRGGSFLCNDEYCSGYRNARRMQSSPDTGLNHTGFRCVKDL